MNNFYFQIAIAITSQLETQGAKIPDTMRMWSKWADSKDAVTAGQYDQESAAYEMHTRVCGLLRRMMTAALMYEMMAMNRCGNKFAVRLYD